MMLRTALELCLFYRCVEKNKYGEKALNVYRDGDCGDFGKALLKVARKKGHHGTAIHSHSIDHIITQLKDRVLDKDFYLDIKGIINPVPHIGKHAKHGDEIAFGDISYIDSVCGNYCRKNNDPLNGWNYYYGHETRGQWPPHRHPKAPAGAMEDPAFYEERIQKFMSYLIDVCFPEWQNELRRTQGEKKTIMLPSEVRIKQVEIMNEYTSSYYLPNKGFGKIEL